MYIARRRPYSSYNVVFVHVYTTARSVHLSSASDCSFRIVQYFLICHTSNIEYMRALSDYIVSFCRVMDVTYCFISFQFYYHISHDFYLLYLSIYNIPYIKNVVNTFLLSWINFFIAWIVLDDCPGAEEHMFFQLVIKRTDLTSVLICFNIH